MLIFLIILAYFAVGVTTSFSVLTYFKTFKPNYPSPGEEAVGTLFLWPLAIPVLIGACIVRFMDAKSSEIAERYRSK